MVKRHYDLPSLKMLATFECAARCGSFKVAAAELNVTTSAISHQVKSLEQELGLRLFERGHRLVHLTPDGQELMLALSNSFAALSEVITMLRKKNETPQLTVGATTAVSSLWLTPRVTQFWRAHGDITVSQNVRDRPFPRPLQPDLVIEYTIIPPKGDAIRLFGDTLIPLCSPSFQSAPVTDLTLLAQAPLIHMDAAETNWTNWPNWFETQGYTGAITTRQRVNNYTIALQLAQDGIGVVLGWKRLVQPLLDAGHLVPFSPFQIEAPGAFYLIFKNGVRKRPEVESFSDWLLSCVE
jgi:LysR family transcriptional regulator, glycine cleavage system transcriptional activator